MLQIKIIVDDGNVELTRNVVKAELAQKMGETMYAVEQMTKTFITSSLYDTVMANVPEKFNSRGETLYNENGLKIRVRAV